MRTMPPSPGRDDFLSARWLLDQLPLERAYEVEEAWKNRGLARIPLGRRLDSIRVHDTTALRAIELLPRPVGDYHGLLYHQRLRQIEFLVPRDTAIHWSGGFPTVRARGRDREGFTVCPRPGALVRQAFWIRPPGPHLVSPLHIARALTQLGVPGIRYDPPRRYASTGR
ncbi:hypothetical protein GCM10010406_40300 [Streptomyces thermolineatus]|uniref:Uncharacterized protein n=1 Tax=Streptomyces thermolineatus TaxID=44033 RepID=A0ABN3MD72_9ACTN